MKICYNYGQIARAAICVRWSPLEDRFAVGSGCKLVAVCCFDKALDWWVSKRIKKQIKSTVTCLDWHPNNSVLACGSSDFRVRVYSAFIQPGVQESEWGNHGNLGSLLFEHYESEGEYCRNFVCIHSSDYVALEGLFFAYEIINAVTFS